MKIGDKVKVVANFSNHQFALKQEVEVFMVGNAGEVQAAKGADGKWWCLSTREVQPIKKKKA